MGDSPAQTPTTNAKSLVEAQKSLPDVMRILNSQITPSELARFGASTITSPGYGNLQTQIYDTSGRELNRIGSSIAGENAQGEIHNNINALTNGGFDLVHLSNLADRISNPEFYRTRENTSNAINDRLTRGGLSETERSEIERSLNRQNQQQGTLDVPSATATVNNALTYGRAGRDSLDNALTQANQFLTTSRNGVNSFAVGTGKTTTGNTGDTKFLGVQPPGQEANAVNANLLGQNSQLLGQSRQIDSQRQSGFSNVMGSLPDY